MLKSLTLGTLALVLSAGLAQAQTPMMPCSDANMMKMDTDMAKMSDAKMKGDAMKEMQMAKDMMAKKDDKGCMEHMDKAMKMMPK